ncbi:glycoside hydrolase [Crocinitomix catalasitica]|nr:glycoside hydrolase [Crocinitomix catalasitica]
MKVPTLLLILFFASGISAQKIKGLSFVAAPEPVDSFDVKPMVEVNANWVCIMPYGFLKDGKVLYNSRWQWYGEKTKGARESIQLCQQQGLKIMLKPQIWIPAGYTGDYKLDNNTQWSAFEASYLEFITEFVNLAIELEVELFCIGTEWREFVNARPKFWSRMIKETRSTYKGELTYASNWDDYDNVPFWSALDYIGVDAYFPICLSTKSKLREMCVSWKKHGEALANYSIKLDRKILFTEFGYRSLKGTTRNPWVSDTKGKFDEEEQNNGYKSIFRVVWNEEWFAGGFIWKWFNNHEAAGGNNHLGFTPQNKMAEEIIREFWAED